MTNEYGVWIPGYEGLYSITESGVVYSHSLFRRSKPRQIKGDGKYVTLHKDEETHTRRSISSLLHEAYPTPLPHNEKWLVGYEGLYSVDSNGVVYTWKHGKKPLKVQTVGGQKCVSVTKDNLKETIYLKNIKIFQDILP